MHPQRQWIEGRTIYHLHALGAAGGRGLAQLTTWLDHIASLGCGAVLLTPIHHSSNHGYDTVDPFRVDPRLGDDAAFDRFVERCRELDLRVVLDGVFNHVGREFPQTQLLSGGTWEGHDELPTLDHENPDVLDWADAVATHWLDRGANGWRFDVGYAIPRQFLSALAARIRDRHPGAFLFGEIIHGDYAGLAGTGLDAVTQYELFKATWSACNDANMWELAWALGRHAEYASRFGVVTFLGNHDVTRIASNLHDPAHLEIALAVLFTVPGVPCVYYGDEFGWTGEKENRAGGDDAIRQPLPDQPVGHPFVDQHRRWIAFRKDRPWLTGAPLEVVTKTNTTLEYTVGGLRVRLDLQRGVELSEAS